MVAAGERSKMRIIEVGDCGVDHRANQSSPQPGPWLGDLPQPWTDRQIVRTECRRAPRLHEQVHQERPDLHGRTLCQELVQRRTDGESSGGLDGASSNIRANTKGKLRAGCLGVVSTDPFKPISDTFFVLHQGAASPLGIRFS